MKENFPTNSEGVKKILLEEAQKTDPTKSSPLPEKLDFGAGKEYKNKYQSDRDLKDIETGEIYIEKQGYEQDIEHFVSLLSKGILHVSDFIEKDGKYYSHKMPIEQIEPGTKEEIEAELFVLHYLFGDWDHYHEEPEKAKSDALVNSYNSDVSHHKNFIKNEKDQFAHFDYNIAFRSARGPFDFHKKNNFLFKIKTKKFLNKGFENMLNDKENKLEPRTNKTTDHEEITTEIAKKIESFSKALNDKLFFNAIIDKSGLSIESQRFYHFKSSDREGRIEEFRKYLLNRVHILKTILN